MSKDSLMNPDFLRKELADTITLLADNTAFVQEAKDDFERVLGYFIDADQGSLDNVTLSKEQSKDIIQVLSKIQLNAFRITSPHRVAISQYRQLLKDSRYRIATKLTRFLKK